MSLIDKSNDNYLCALNEEKKNHFDIATSRFYYSIYQKILYYICEKNLLPPNYNVKNSHMALQEYTSKLLNFPKDEAVEKISTFNSEFVQLKSLRTKADYKKDHIKRSDIKLAKKYYENLKNILEEGLK